MPSGSTFSSRPRSHAACPRYVVPSWQRQDGANLQGTAWERLPERLLTKLRKFLCATCAVSKRTRRYRRSKRVKVAAAERVKVAAAKRAPQTHTLRKRTSEQEAQKQDSWYSYQAVAVTRMSAYFRERTGSGKSSHRFLPLSQLF